jgi:hypothetical protein
VINTASSWFVKLDLTARKGIDGREVLENDAGLKTGNQSEQPITIRHLELRKNLFVDILFASDNVNRGGDAGIIVGEGFEPANELSPVYLIIMIIGHGFWNSSAIPDESEMEGTEQRVRVLDGRSKESFILMPVGI